MKYHIWTIGCQMNVSDSQYLSGMLDRLGMSPAEKAGGADVVVLNTCVVRQSAEDKASGFLWSLKALKKQRPEMIIALMGCMVGYKGLNGLQQRFPHVDVFMPPGEPQPLLDFIRAREMDRMAGDDEREELSRRYHLQDTALPLHLGNMQPGIPVSLHLPIILGCNHVCTYCIIPYRRGQERSRPAAEILDEARLLAEKGVKEITLLGQIVDRYGYDLPAGASLPNLLEQLSDIHGLERIRFLTSHPNYFDDRLQEAVAALPKVCEHIEIPVQAGDDEILQRMKREYSADDYRRKIEDIRRRLPDSSIATDLIVGFPGETEAQFQASLDLLAELKVDVCHVAMYSPRPGTVSAKLYDDDIPPEEKKARLDAVNVLQEHIAAEINAAYLGRETEILIEDRHKGKWRGRTRTNKLVFFEDPGDWRGKLAQVRINWTGPWSMQAELLPGA